MQSALSSRTEWRCRRTVPERLKLRTVLEITNTLAQKIISQSSLPKTTNEFRQSKRHTPNTTIEASLRAESSDCSDRIHCSHFTNFVTDDIWYAGPYHPEFPQIQKKEIWSWATETEPFSSAETPFIRILSRKEEGNRG